MRKESPDLPSPSPSNTSELSKRLSDLMLREGSVSVADFMEEAISHYYAAHEPFGVEGDFTTAPEISQMFGEMIGAWFTDLWLQSGRPESVKLIEIGPGRGTLAADIMRTISAWPEFSAAVSLHLVETSPMLRQKQAETLRHWRPTWYDRLEEVPVGTSFIVANEFFDALPVHQFEKADGLWHERRVTFNRDTHAFEFTRTVPDFDISTVMPAEFMDAEDSSIFEISPASLSVLETISKRIVEFGGAALMIDYGHSEIGLGDTLQAVSRHEFVDALQNPGEVDLTAHVDFGTLATVASQYLRVHGPVTQGEFLTRLGIMQRAEALREEANDVQKKDIEQALFRLIAPSEMGKLFKVMGLTALNSTVQPSGFAESEENAEISDHGA